MDGESPDKEGEDTEEEKDAEYYQRKAKQCL